MIKIGLVASLLIIVANCFVLVSAFPTGQDMGSGNMVQGQEAGVVRQ